MFNENTEIYCVTDCIPVSFRIIIVLKPRYMAITNEFIDFRAATELRIFKTIEYSSNCLPSIGQVF